MSTQQRELGQPAIHRTAVAGEARRLVKAFGYSCAGLASAFRTQASFRTDLFAVAVLLPVALWLGRDWAERGILIGTLLLILFAEIVNSALEAVVDRIGFDYHHLSKQAKDLGSAAVLLALLICFVIWGGVALDRFQLL
jgi:diacylglycerol kinase (ATP)